MQVERSYFEPIFGKVWMKDSGERVSNTWVIYPKVGNNTLKGVLIPHDVPGTKVLGMKDGLCFKLSP